MAGCVHPVHDAARLCSAGHRGGSGTRGHLPSGCGGHTPWPWAPETRDKEAGLGGLVPGPAANQGSGRRLAQGQLPIPGRGGSSPTPPSQGLVPFLDQHPWSPLCSPPPLRSIFDHWVRAPQGAEAQAPGGTPAHLTGPPGSGSDSPRKPGRGAQGQDPLGSSGPQGVRRHRVKFRVLPAQK